MAKLRVYELARELNIESKLMVNRLKQLGIDVASHQSTLSDAQAEAARTAIKGGISKPIAGVAARPSAKKVVIRRRRRAEEPEDEAEESPAVQAESEAESPTQEAAPEEMASPAAAEAAPEQAVVAEETPAEALESSPAEEAPSQQAEADAERSEEPKKELKKATPPEFAATIVRKASPEEVAARKTRSEQGSRKPRRPERAPSSQGGAGAAGAGAQRGGEERVTALHSAAHEEANRTWGRKGHKERDKVEAAPDHEEERKRRAAMAKKRGRTLNARDLLNSIEIEGDVDPEVLESPVARKTVYTPSAPSRKRDLKRRKDLKKTQITTPRAAYRVVEMTDQITVHEFAKQLAVKSTDIIKKLMDNGLMVTINSAIDFDTACLIANEYNFEVKNVTKSLDDVLGTKKLEEKYSDAEKVSRPPIVTVMGHVDHGKTSILDAIRSANVTEGEAGGITQHIGAYSVKHGDGTITFIDTPGHEAFSTMRARGANATDIVILVVAADDGVMPQTVEAISHARAAGVPIIVAVNKIDKPNTNIDRVYTELAEHGIQSEDWGGDTQFVKVSALQRIGLDELLEAILLQAEILELKAVPGMPARGVVVEAHLDKGRGPVATILVQDGYLTRGDHLVAGTAIGRVRLMVDHNGKEVQKAGPAMPVEVIGLADVPMAGDAVNVTEDEKTAKAVADLRIDQKAQAAQGTSSAASLDDLLSKVRSEEMIEVPVIIKADTQGSVEALAEAILKCNTDKVKNKIIHRAVGGITESDVTLGQAAGAVIIGFNVRAASKLQDEAEKQGVIIQYFSIIYEAIDAIKAVMAGRLPPILKETVTGHAEVRDPIKIPKIGIIAGSAVTDGKIMRNTKLRLIRDDVVIYDGKIGSLRRFKEDVSEVKEGYECGIALEGYTDIKPGDVIEAYIVEEIQATL